MTTSDVSNGIVEFAEDQEQVAVVTGYTPAEIVLHVFEDAAVPHGELPVIAEVVWRSYAGNAVLIREYNGAGEAYFMENTFVGLTERGFTVDLGQIPRPGCR